VHIGSRVVRVRRLRWAVLGYGVFWSWALGVSLCESPAAALCFCCAKAIKLDSTGHILATGWCEAWFLSKFGVFGFESLSPLSFDALHQMTVCFADISGCRWVGDSIKIVFVFAPWRKPRNWCRGEDLIGPAHRTPRAIYWQPGSASYFV
jgi:hypothetical protein